MFDEIKPGSLIDVGCGTGTWIKTAMELGVKDILGLDGVNVPPQELLIPQQHVVIQDFTQDWDLGRRFDLALCLEVGEHLDQIFASRLVRNLARHSDTVMFSAACPGQVGEHHVNCQWPAYWQKLFNDEGFFCEDSLRWKIWNDGRIEPWYRQNIFLALRDANRAGREERLRPVIHPEFLYGTEYQVVR
ncbi:MAG TPA: methyltransferase domain-containing protein, partial [Candidatus Cybelea sp.]|nr:methyltransferase domain-containing protein [Candidatus Cybelea sp.]